MKNKKNKRTMIGGQAVMEGIMMRGAKSMALAVRDPEGNLLITTQRLKKKKGIISRIPVIRGAIIFFQTMIIGVKILLKSAEVYSEEEGEKGISNGGAFFAVFLGLAFSVGLFIFLPSLISDGSTFLIEKIWGVRNDVLTSVIEGVTRLLIFLIYLVLVSLLKDIRRTFMYHGAEHKTINCFEKDLELNVENVKNCSRLHDRCGTNFLFLVILISILLFTISNTVFNWASSYNPVWLFFTKWYGKIIVRLFFMPLVAGISYELLKFLAKLPDNLFVRIIKYPGLALQYITTKEPDDSMIEVAIRAFSAVEKMDADETLPEVNWEELEFTPIYHELSLKLRMSGIGQSEADWIFVHILKTDRLSLKTQKYIKRSQYYKAKKIVEQRTAKGLPLQYLLGETDFCGNIIQVDANVLIPRFETEILADTAIEQAKKISKTGAGLKILDIGTGSGCIAITAARELKDAKITASDISPSALKVAKKNAKNLNNIEFVESDLFEKIQGTFDIIVSNPPYIKTADLANLPKEVKAEPRKALDGGDDGLIIINKIIKDAPNHLLSGGILLMETGFGQPPIVMEMLKNDFKDCAAINDLDGIERIVIAKKV